MRFFLEGGECYVWSEMVSRGELSGGYIRS